MGSGLKIGWDLVVKGYGKRLESGVWSVPEGAGWWDLRLGRKIIAGKSPAQLNPMAV